MAGQGREQADAAQKPTHLSTAGLRAQSYSIPKREGALSPPAVWDKAWKVTFLKKHFHRAEAAAVCLWGTDLISTLPGVQAEKLEELLNRGILE